MLKAGYTPRVIPSRTGACVRCGIAVQSKTVPRKYCAACAADQHLTRSRRGMEKQRRKREIPQIKGMIIACRRCGIAVERNRGIGKWCDACALEVTKERARKISAARKGKPDGYRYQNEWARQRRKSDPAWRVSAHMRTMIHRGIGKHKEGRSWREFVPYSLDELMRHLELQFTDGMCWEKMGSEIHIDHILPLSSFSFSKSTDDDFKAAWALTNLRPLWAGENIRKSATRLHLI